MDTSTEHTEARMRRLHEDSSSDLSFSRRMSEDSSFEIEHSDLSGSFSENLLTDDDDDHKGNKSSAKSYIKWFVFGACVLFFLVIGNIYYVINENEKINIYEKDFENTKIQAGFDGLEETLEQVVKELEDAKEYIQDEIMEDNNDGREENSDKEKEETENKAGKTVVFDINDNPMEVSILDGDIVIPDDVMGMLNPHSREHWMIIEAALALAFDEYDDTDKDEEFEEDKNYDETSKEDEDSLQKEIGNIDPIQIPGGLKYTPPPTNEEEHKHTEDCEPAVVDVVDENILEANETEEDLAVTVKMPSFDNL